MLVVGYWFIQPVRSFTLDPIEIVGVAIFFVVSGFCIHLSFRRGAPGDWRGFFIRRFFRIYPPYFLAVLIFAFFFWPGTARQVRGVAQSVRGLDYVDAARVLGASNRRIMLQHVLPNLGNIVLVVAGFDVAGAILGESALSFLGFGVQVPLASWGNMLSAAQDNRVFNDFPWMLIPGVFIFVAVMAWNFLGDGLRDAADPRTLG